jgi:hypothetical protein
VGERLKPTDCKSVPLRRYGGSNPPLCTRIDGAELTASLWKQKRLLLALLAYAVLGVLAWTTLTDEKLRGATLLILGLFAVKSILRRNDVMHPDEDDSKLSR